MTWLVNREKKVEEAMMEMINQIHKEKKDKEIKTNNKSYLICQFLN